MHQFYYKYTVKIICIYIKYLFKKCTEQFEYSFGGAKIFKNYNIGKNDVIKEPI